MGKYSDELARIAVAPHHGFGRDAAALSSALDDAGRTLAVTASDPGWSGDAADAAAEMFSLRARRARSNSDLLADTSDIVGQANAARDRAQRDCEGLPPATMSAADFAAVSAGGWLLLGPFGAFNGIAGALFANAVLDFNSEQEARPIFVRFQAEMGNLAARLNSISVGLQVPDGARPAGIPEYHFDREESTMSPWEVGWEWLTGQGNSREFEEKDEFTQLLRQHPHYQELREELSQQDLYVGWKSNGGEYSYALSGVEGVGKYVIDYSTLLTGGRTGKLAVTYLGSHSVDVEVIGQRPDGGFEVRITAQNTSSLQSAIRPPVIGYHEWYLDTVGAAINQFSETTGIGRTTDQTIVWTETIYP